MIIINLGSIPGYIITLFFQFWDLFDTPFSFICSMFIFYPQTLMLTVFLVLAHRLPYIKGTLVAICGRAGKLPMYLFICVFVQFVEASFTLNWYGTLFRFTNTAVENKQLS